MAKSDLSAQSSSDSLWSDYSATSAPDKLSPAVKGPMTWAGADLAPQQYITQLSEQDVQDIRAAVIKVKIAGTPRSEIRQATFDVANPALVKKLAAISPQVHHELGVAVLRGLDTANFNDEEAVIAFTGICSWIFPERATDSYANQTLSHVRDASKQKVPEWAKGIGLAGSKIPVAMDFHSDRFSGDVLALHVRNDGGIGAGGEQFLASFWAIYNELLERDPEVLETMAEATWPFELKQKNKEPYLEHGPTLFFSKGRPMCQLVKAPLLGTPLIPRDASMPSLTKKQLHAINTVEETARRLSTKLDRKQGDIQFVHNLSIMHARAAYRGQDGKPSSRHLLRMFLRDADNAWEKPLAHRRAFDDPFTPGRQQNIPVIDNDPWRLISGRESHG